MTRLHATLLAGLLTAFLTPGLAKAAGGASDDKPPTCPAGYVLKNNACVKVTSGILPDDELYKQGRAFAKHGFYREALPILAAIRRTDDSMVYTMRGFALRKMGRAQEGLAFYGRALALDPDNANTYEYLGAYHVETGNLDMARIALARIEAICGGRSCEQYEDLAKAIETGVTE